LNTNKTNLDFRISNLLIAAVINLEVDKIHFDVFM